ncbi:MAG: rod shape-determining protein RodA [Candidatus Kerfeldbacteria bacterium CG08_land_8_20_14_0_20_43_14]|uniref:Rod shape-determining protein RodA n=1 Tax=Candidatus Kerfeldbacteria bacterium CG08_land_8_20_14_0_20_43_14 TaxID=2014246 RepID=A0A2H0YS00_9BACT|nr:MAG: rod shape-determining protein RodA [Candidatus Kerfeldbacteria bacterium CG08_land_8_20_14_0_20_43_14]
MARLSFRAFRQIDWLLLSATILLLLFGLVTLASVTVAKSPPEWSVFFRQLIFFGIGAFISFFVIFFDYRVLRGYSSYIYLLALVLLIGVLFFGKTINNTTGWFVFAGISFQPVELIKLLWIIAFGSYLSRYARAFNQWRHLAISGVFMLVLLVLIMRQPDLGSAVIILAIYIGLLLMANIKLKQLAILFLILLTAGVMSYFFLLQTYQKDRIQVLFHPGSDPLNRGYNVTQSMIAIGSGQFFGRGFGQGTQSQLNFLPEQQTDFIFSVFAEEFGFFGAGLMLIAFGGLLVRSIIIAGKSKEDFGSFLSAGIGIWFAVQMFINVGMNMGLLPVTGVPLPLVSAGGSSLIAGLISIGLMQSVFLRARTTT